MRSGKGDRPLVHHARQLKVNLDAGVEENLETDSAALEREVNSVTRNHRPVWFIDLLKEARYVPELQSQAALLKDLLGIEEVHVDCNAENELRDLDVVLTEGTGRRSVVSEVVENGYVQRETGAVLMRPKVKVRLVS